MSSSTSLPPTPGRLIYDLERAIELLIEAGSHPGDARVMVTEALTVAWYDSTTIANLKLQDAMADATEPRPSALFDYRVRQAVDVVLRGSADDAVVAAGWLRRFDPAKHSVQIHRQELERWGIATGVLTAAEVSDGDREARRAAFALAEFERLHKAGAAIPTTNHEWHLNLQERDPDLFRISIETFQREWNLASWPLTIGPLGNTQRRSTKRKVHSKVRKRT